MFRFVAIVRKPLALPIGTVTYDELLIDLVGPNFDPATGIFTTTQAGVYLFTFDGFVYTSCPCGALTLYVNHQDFSHTIESSYHSSRSIINGMKAVSLREGDEVFLRNEYSSCIWGDELHPFTFMGTLLY